ncbi:hypothetical protein [Peterkaempfera sp. SMS 1(5)a]|uniref:hypothetical protein n=1 Tax=Peterkaempfera podocarpi TaxID=3232308 RepID=UPI00366FCC8D
MPEHRKRIGYPMPSAPRGQVLRERRHKQARRWSRLVAIHAVKGAATAAGGIVVGLLWHYLNR